ncbi:preprotein translocase subunit SecF [Rhodobacteraceae bacterium THAF1]|uniref:protein translocase subunit SecF n=1 Tax=Palleronia sp. THAF1 TaxID=2587842 RepID=UPI000F4076B8|nr:protein translocase subunit SecF [Palleronia sp. THAF1]QFU09008.1 preprotein translocase subunit SecF [Palleronia sp. THAF1]VDC24249.1 preprotein translocase subunit SecF [Rhodobacteraceae bacterium THAF1]
MRLKLVPENTDWDFFKYARATFGASCVAIVLSLVAWLALGLNFGIDFQGGTTIRTQAEETVVVSEYRDALGGLDLGDVVISEVFDPTFGPDENVAMVRIAAQDGAEAVTPETIERVQAALQDVAPTLEFTSVESVGPKVSGELIQAAFLAVAASLAAILFYIWLRFEWQFSVGAVAALFHDVVLTIGIFSILQIQFDLATIAAILTIIGYSINDTVVIFDRLRENLIKYKSRDLRDVMNLSVNETLSRTVMTSGTTLVALIALLVLGGDVIRGFVFAIAWGVIVGTYSSVFVAKNIVLFLGVKRDWSKPDKTEGNQFAQMD